MHGKHVAAGQGVMDGVQSERLRSSTIPTQERSSPRESSFGKEILPIIASFVVGEVVTSGGHEVGSRSRAGGDRCSIHIQSRKSHMVRGWAEEGYASVGIQSMGPDVALFGESLWC